MEILPSLKMLRTTFTSATVHRYCVLILILSTLGGERNGSSAQAWITDVKPILRINNGE